MADIPELTSEDATLWFSENVPDDWFEALRTMVDRDEIMVVGSVAAGGDEPNISRIERFREETRDERIAVAIQAEAKFGRKVSWSTECGETSGTFTHLAVPVMTRLRIGERHTLDTLVSAGVARSRSDALGWCVRLVSKHEGDWLDELREAIVAVDKIRATGPN